jgi:hypothetical protein
MLTLKMEAVCSYEILMSTYKSKERYSTEEKRRLFHRYENFKFYLMYTVIYRPNINFNPVSVSVLFNIYNRQDQRRLRP